MRVIPCPKKVLREGDVIRFRPRKRYTTKGRIRVPEDGFTAELEKNLQRRYDEESARDGAKEIEQVRDLMEADWDKWLEAGNPPDWEIFSHYWITGEKPKPALPTPTKDIDTFRQDRIWNSKLEERIDTVFSVLKEAPLLLRTAIEDYLEGGNVLGALMSFKETNKLANLGLEIVESQSILPDIVRILPQKKDFNLYVDRWRSALQFYRENKDALPEEFFTELGEYYSRDWIAYEEVTSLWEGLLEGEWDDF